MADILSTVSTALALKQDADPDLTTWAGCTPAAGILTFLATPSSANLRAAVTDESGTGALLFAGGNLGTPSGGVLTSCTGLPITGLDCTAAARSILDDTTISAILDTLSGGAANGTGAVVLTSGATLDSVDLGTAAAGDLRNCTNLPLAGIQDLAAGMATFLATPSSANLRAAVTDESGTGALLFAGGAFGTPSSLVLTNATGLPIAGGGTGATTAVGAADALLVKGADIASATTTNIASATGVYVHITGTTTITAFGTAAAGVIRVLRFAGALTLTHHATSLILPSAANIVTVANDVAVMVSEGSGNWRCVAYQRTTTPLSLQSTRTMALNVISAQSSTTWTNMPAAHTVLLGNLCGIRRVDLSSYSQCRLNVIQAGGAAVSGAKLRLRYKTSSGSSSADAYSLISASEVEVSLGTTTGEHYLESSWVDLVAGAKADVYIAVTGISGDGAADPTLYSVVAEFR